MTERGSLRLGRTYERGLLNRHEGPSRGHTLDRHVGKSKEWLHDRVVHHPTATHASSFADDASADRIVSEAIRNRSDVIHEWLTRGRHQLRLDVTLDRSTGVSVNAAGEAAHVNGVRLILVKDPSIPEGYWIKTAFPQP
jgi:hypothetical protein